MHPTMRETILQNPKLFKIITPIKVDVFEDLLVGHPNPSFVKSVSDGLQYGFWPWADIWIGNGTGLQTCAGLDAGLQGYGYGYRYEIPTRSQIRTPGDG